MGKLNCSSNQPAPATDTAVAAPNVDQRQLINCWRRCGPAAAPITTVNVMLTMVCGMVAIAQSTITAVGM